MGKLRVAAVQFALRPERHLDELLRHTEQLVTRAASLGAQLVVFPELMATGLLASATDAAELRVSDMKRVYRELFPGYAQPFVAAMRSMAMASRITILAGSHFCADQHEGYRNVAHLVHADGRLETQQKLHLTPPEVGLALTPGDELLITQIGVAHVGIQICMDLEFPELTRWLALRGVDLVLAPSLTFNRRGANRVRYSALARAVENQLFVVTSPLVGTCGVPTDGPIHGTGVAMICAPLDRRIGVHDGVLAQSRAQGDEVVVAELDFEAIRLMREDPEPPGLKNLRPELYARLAAMQRS